MNDVKHPALLGLAAAVALGISGVASAVPSWCTDGPPCTGGPGGGEEEEGGNNLSLPTRYVPDTTGAPVSSIGCDVLADNFAPGDDGQMATFPPEDPVYWVQKTAATWSGDCVTGGTGVEVSADWGDNLTGDAPAIKSGKPIRVEVSLTQTNDDTGPHTGYEVLKLTDELDRLATYGTDGTTLSQNYRVWDAGASLMIETCADTLCASPQPLLQENPMLAEINSIGAVVYGYNWGTKKDAPAPGIYKITFQANNTTIRDAVDAKASYGACDGKTCTWVIVTLAPGGGQGGGGGNPNQ